MDTTETYIKMRRKAIPDLGMGQPPLFSMGAEVTWFTTFVCVDIKGDFYYSSKDETFQLERQDQLQEMYKSFKNENLLNDEYAPLDNIEMAQDFNAWLETFTKKEPYSWLNNPTDIRGWVAPSMERLWLAFVIKERYNKVWNGEEWIKS